MTSRGVGARLPSSRPLPPVILLLVAALAVALGPAVGGRIGSVPTASVTAAAPAGPMVHGVAGHDREVAPPAPRRLDLRHPSAGSAAVERPTLDALPPAAVVAGPLLAPVAAYGSDERRRGLTLPRGSARAPPASAA